MRDVSSHRADYVFLASIALLVVFGLVMLTSASAAIGRDSFHDSYFFVKRQIVFGVLPGLAAFLLFANIPYHTLRRMAFPLFLFANTLLLLVFVPQIGSSYGTNARSWLTAFGVSFQPAEFAKMGLVLFLAWYLSALGERMKDLTRGFLQAASIAGIPLLLIVLQPDVGTASIVFAIIYGMFFLARARVSHLFAIALVALVALSVMIVATPYRSARFTTFLHPELDQAGQGYQINQAFLAIGSGGMFGRGYGQSVQKFQYLPEVHGDSIFAVIAEEMGFVVAGGFVMLVLFLALRGFMIAKYAPDEFGRLLVGGTMMWFLTQSFLNLGAMTGILPLTGVPLPFVSHGGSSLAVAMGAVGMIANVSKHTDI